jgi:hypothetical protein
MNLKKIIYLVAVLAATALIVSGCTAGGSEAVRIDNIETHFVQFQQTGSVHWYRNDRTALAEANPESESPPLFIYLHRATSIQGESGSVFFHPLAVEAIETLFLPVAHDGDSGTGPEILENLQFEQTAIIMTDHGGNLLTDPVVDDASLEHVTAAMIDSLSAAGLQIPEYLRIVYGESRGAGEYETAVVTQHCFWSGEVELGVTEGILGTEPGAIEKAEALRITFDPQTISYRELLEEAKALGLLDRAFPMNEEQYSTANEVLDEKQIAYFNEIKYVPVRNEKHYKFYLGKTTYRYVPMTSRQSIMVNNALFFEEDPSHFLSPRQVQMYDYIKGRQNKKWQSHINDDDFRESWENTTDLIAKYSRDKIIIN